MRSLVSLFVAATTFLFGAYAVETPFPGPWERYIQAPDASRIVRPSRIYYTEGKINHCGNTTILRGPGALVTYEFPQNIGGR